MSLSDWHITQLARRIIGSLGPTKADLETSNDFVYRAPASEQNLIRDICGYVLEAIGLPVGYASDSIRGRLDALEEGALSPTYFLLREPFIGYSADELRAPWGHGMFAPWHYAEEQRGGARGPLDAASCASLPGRPFRPLHAPRIFFGETLSGDPGTGVSIGLYGAVNTAAGVRFVETDRKIQAFVKTGGIEVLSQVLGEWTPYAEVTVDMRIASDGSWTVSIDGGPAVSITEDVDRDDLGFVMSTSADGDAGETVVIRNLLIGADWSQHDSGM